MTKFICEICNQVDDDGLLPEETAALEKEFELEGNDLDEYVALCEICSAGFMLFHEQGVGKQ